jgi:ADP-ribose pyrophosphatase YjhB (NUDIX family)
MFNNVQNKMIKDESGKVHWISRSVVVICLVAWNNKILIVRRGKKVTQTGKWCLPCGYLDFNETIEECAIREIYEESGVDLRQFNHEIKLEKINSDPSTDRQNIGFHYLIQIDSEKEPEVDLGVVDYYETTDSKWIDVSEAENFKFAFNHLEKIKKYAESK